MHTHFLHLVPLLPDILLNTEPTTIFQNEVLQSFCLKPILQTYRNWRNLALSSCKQARQGQCWGQRGRASLQVPASPVPKCLQDISTSRHYWIGANSCLLYLGLLHIPRTCPGNPCTCWHLELPGGHQTSTGCWHGQDASKTGPSLGSKSCLLESAEILLLVVGNSQDHRVSTWINTGRNTFKDSSERPSPRISVATSFLECWQRLFYQHSCPQKPGISHLGAKHNTQKPEHCWGRERGQERFQKAFMCLNLKIGKCYSSGTCNSLENPDLVYLSSTKFEDVILTFLGAFFQK